MPVRMDWSRGCGAEDTEYIPGQAGPPARTCACIEVPAEQEKAAGGVAAWETNKAAAQDSARAEKARERRKKKRSKQRNLRERGWPSDHGRPAPLRAATEQQAATQEGRKTGQQTRLASIEAQLAATEAKVAATEVQLAAAMSLAPAETPKQPQECSQRTQQPQHQRDQPKGHSVRQQQKLEEPSPPHMDWSRSQGEEDAMHNSRRAEPQDETAAGVRAMPPTNAVRGRRRTG
jgi:hypothetical protein